MMEKDCIELGHDSMTVLVSVRSDDPARYYADNDPLPVELIDFGVLRWVGHHTATTKEIIKCRRCGEVKPD